MTTNEKLATGSIPKLMVTLGLPSMVAQFINVLYNMVDRMYIGHIEGAGDLALTGLGLCFPIITLISAFSSFIGMGGAPLAAIEMGRGNQRKAERILSNGVTVLICFSVLLTLFFMVFQRPLLYLFGASDNTIVYSQQYLSIYLCGTIFVQLALGLNPYITCQGRAKIAMMSVIIGAVLNIILDPIFIFGLHMGVRGAALATIISQAVSAIWIAIFLTGEQTTLRIRRKYLKPRLSIVQKVMLLGIAPFIMQSTESLISIVLNKSLSVYGGDLYVGSLTIMQSVMQLMLVPMQGFSQGCQPITSYNYGAQNFDRVKKTVRILLTITFSMTVVGCALTMLFPGFFARIFTTHEELIQLVEKVMPIYMGGIWMFGIQNGCQSTFLGLGQAKISLFLALLRKIILLIPLALILPHFMGVMGVYWAEPISDILAATCTGSLFLFSYKRILSVEALKKI